MKPKNTGSADTGINSTHKIEVEYQFGRQRQFQRRIPPQGCVSDLVVADVTVAHLFIE